MIRVLYRWRVQKGQEDKFVEAWSEVTRAIRDNFEGARGSVLLRGELDDGKFVALAKWDSFEAWKAFHDGPRPHAGAFQTMVIVGELMGTEIFEEIEDLSS